MIVEVALLSSIAWAMPQRPAAPEVTFTDNKVAAAPQASARNPQLEILDSQQCKIQTLSDTQLQVGDPCEYAGGVLSYNDEKDPKKRKQTGFSLRKSGESRIWLLGKPEQSPTP